MKALILLPVVIFMSIGCGASGIQYQAAAADAMRTINDQAVVVVEEQCGSKSAEAASNTAVSVDQAQADAEAVLDTCRDISASQHLVAEAHTTWVAAMLKQISSDEFEMESLLVLAVQAIRLYSDAQVLAERIGIELPAIPDSVQGLIGSIR
jgi:hypothetical protein